MLAISAFLDRFLNRKLSVPKAYRSVLFFNETSDAPQLVLGVSLHSAALDDQLQQPPSVPSSVVRTLCAVYSCIHCAPQTCPSHARRLCGHVQRRWGAVGPAVSPREEVGGRRAEGSSPLLLVCRGRPRSCRRLQADPAPPAEVPGRLQTAAAPLVC